MIFSKHKVLVRSSLNWLASALDYFRVTSKLRLLPAFFNHLPLWRLFSIGGGPEPLGGGGTEPLGGGGPDPSGGGGLEPPDGPVYL